MNIELLINLVIAVLVIRAVIKGIRSVLNPQGTDEAEATEDVPEKSEKKRNRLEDFLKDVQKQFEALENPAPPISPAPSSSNETKNTRPSMGEFHRSEPKPKKLQTSQNFHTAESIIIRDREVKSKKNERAALLALSNPKQKDDYEASEHNHQLEWIQSEFSVEQQMVIYSALMEKRSDSNDGIF